MRTILGRSLVLAALVSAAALVPAIWAPPTARAATGDVTLFDAGGTKPLDITTGPDGNLWFTAPSQNMIGRIIASGPAVGSVKLFNAGGTTQPAQQVQPVGITSGPDGNLWFTSQSQNMIGRITTSGSVTLFPLDAGTQPVDITAGPDGNLWFTSPSRSSIGRITTSGAVKVFPAGGTPSDILGTNGITAGPDGNVWYVLPGNDLIGKITPDGTVTTYAAGGTQPGTITAGPDGNLWFGAAPQEMIGQITTSGSVKTFQDGGIQPATITAGSGHSLWYTGTGQNLIGQISTSGTVLNTFGATQPVGITSGPDGNIWFTETSQQLIGRLSTPPPGTFYWQGPGGTFASAPTQVGALPGGATDPAAVGHGTGDHAMHVFTVDGSGHLWDSFTPDALASTPAFTVTDITAQTGQAVSTAVPVGALYLGGSNPSTQVFALSPAGALLSFVAGGDGQASGNSWQVFPVGSYAGSTAVLDTAPAPIVFGSTVHVYSSDTSGHLHDFVKPSTANWSDIDLTSRVGGTPGGPATPYAYGGNSIQVAVNSAGALQTFVQRINPDGTPDASSTPAAFNITQISGGTESVSGTPRPVVTGDGTVNIAADDTSGHLVDFTKAPTGNWQATIIATLGVAGLTPAAIWDASAGLNIIALDTTGQLTDYHTAATAPPFSSRVLPTAGTRAAGAPAVIAIAQPGTTLITIARM
jgi:streptogramin lyase